jgi:phosphonate transport system permease protein
MTKISNLSKPPSLVDICGVDEIRQRHRSFFQFDLKKNWLFILTFFVAAGFYIYCWSQLGIAIASIWTGGSRFSQILLLMVPPYTATVSMAILFFRSLIESIAIALVGTAIAACFAFPVGFLAASNVVRNSIIHIIVRRLLDTIRGVDMLIWALIWVGVVGLGPFAGVLAIATSDFGTFGKLFSEAIENTDPKPSEGILSTGGSLIHAVRFGTIPDVLPVIASQILYTFESNTRSASVIGIVGAGGIGLQLSESIRTLEWQQTSFLILIVLIAVAVIDVISSHLRRMLKL